MRAMIWSLPLALVTQEATDGYVFVDQTTHPAVVRQLLGRAGSLPVTVILRDPSTLARDLLAWGVRDWDGIRLADPEALRIASALCRRLPCVLVRRRGIWHRAHGVPLDFKEMIQCSRR